MLASGPAILSSPFFSSCYIWYGAWLRWGKQECSPYHYECYSQVLCVLKFCCNYAIEVKFNNLFSPMSVVRTANVSVEGSAGNVQMIPWGHHLNDDKACLCSHLFVSACVNWHSFVAILLKCLSNSINANTVIYVSEINWTFAKLLKRPIVYIDNITLDYWIV